MDDEYDEFGNYIGPEVPVARHELPEMPQSPQRDQHFVDGESTNGEVMMDAMEGT